MTTIKELIEQLETIENKDQKVVFKYYIAQHFIDTRTDDNMEPEVFEKVAANADEMQTYMWDDADDFMSRAVDDIIYDEN